MKDFDKFRKVLIDEKIVTSKEIEIVLSKDIKHVKFETIAVVNNKLTYDKIMEIKKIQEESPMYFLDIAIAKKKIPITLIEELSKIKPSKKEKIAQFLLDNQKCDLCKLLEITNLSQGVDTNDERKCINTNRN